MSMHINIHTVLIQVHTQRGRRRNSQGGRPEDPFGEAGTGVCTLVSPTSSLRSSWLNESCPGVIGVMGCGWNMVPTTVGMRGDEAKWGLLCGGVGNPNIGSCILTSFGSWIMLRGGMFLLFPSSFLVTALSASASLSSASLSSWIGPFLLSTTDGSCVMSGRELDRRLFGAGASLDAASLFGEWDLFPALLGLLTGDVCPETGGAESFLRRESRLKFAGARLPSGSTTSACWRLCRIVGSVKTSGCCCLLFVLLAAAMAAMFCEDIIWKYWLISAAYCEDGLKRRFEAVAGLWRPEKAEVVGRNPYRLLGVSMGVTVVEGSWMGEGLGDLLRGWEGEEEVVERCEEGRV